MKNLTSKVQRPKPKVRGAESKAQSLGEAGRHSKLTVRSSEFKILAHRTAAADYLSRFLCVGLALALFATGCAGPRPLRGGRAVTTHKPAGVIEQTLVQGDNPAQATKQTQETVRVRTYTVPVGSRVEQSQTPGTIAAQTASVSHDSQPSTLNSQPSTSFL